MKLPQLVLFALCVVSPLHAADVAGQRPNILVILADDLGFSDIGCYGSDIATPQLDRLAANGLRFTQCYNTARCWPTRSALMTGYYPQQIHMDPPNGRLPQWTRTLPQWLKPLGYRSYHSGKWHVNGAPLVVADGGFDHSYVLHDHDRNFNPKDIAEDDRPLPPVAKDSGYYTSTAFADHAIRCLKEHAGKYASQPFFSYLAFTVPHFPLQAPPDDIARYRDHYLKGWDQVRQDRWQKLRDAGIVNCALAPLEPAFTPRYLVPGVLNKLGPGEIEHAVPWAELTDEKKHYQATKMAIHAAMIDRMDREIGRVLDQVRAMGAWDNTIILFLSDNGTDASILVRGDGNDRDAPPGSAASFLCLGPGWSSAGNAPFRRHKIWTHEGGISTPLIVHWPKGIAARGELRHDVCHVIDFVPTLLEIAGAKPELPAGAPSNTVGLAQDSVTEGSGQNARATVARGFCPPPLFTPAAALAKLTVLGAPPFPGRSLVPAFAKDGSVTRDTLFFHHEGNRGLRVGNFKVVSAREDQNSWELYDLTNDRCEQHNLAAAQPDRLHDMAARWQQLQAEFTRNAGPTLPVPSAKPSARKIPPKAAK